MRVSRDVPRYNPDWPRLHRILDYASFNLYDPSPHSCTLARHQRRELDTSSGPDDGARRVRGRRREPAVPRLGRAGENRVSRREVRGALLLGHREGRSLEAGRGLRRVGRVRRWLWPGWEYAVPSILDFCRSGGHLPCSERPLVHRGGNSRRLHQDHRMRPRRRAHLDGRRDDTGSQAATSRWQEPPTPSRGWARQLGG